MDKIKKIKKTKSPFVILLSGFAILILIGTLLLLLPFATKQNQNISFIDAFFLSTSAVCVTGLVSTPLPLSDLLSPFGVGVLWLLIEVGGLGFITLVTFAFSFAKKKVNVSTNLLLKEAMNQNSFQELIPLAKKIVIASFSIQFVGFVFIYISLLMEGFNPLKALGYSFFHAASSFNNAGFDIFGSDSLVIYKNNILLMITTSLLIILGGIGFVVMFDVMKKRKFVRLNLHSKIVINTTILILIGGTLIVKLSDWNISLFDAFLQVVFARTAGFYSLNLATLRNSTIVILMIIMFVGGSPASIAGGVKTTTFYTIMRSIFCFGKGKKNIISHNREIKQESVLKSYVLVTLAFTFIMLMSLLIFFIEDNLQTDLSKHPYFFKEVLFEAVSAFATCGTSLGITNLFSIPSKIIIIVLMYFGRLGPITFISLLNKGYGSNDERIQYVKSDIIIG